MMWLASFPRSGNTFMRLVLHEAYGIESSTFHTESDYPLDPDYSRLPIVKTHLLPEQLQPADPSVPAVYLVRDGRDCVVSMAHYRKSLIAADSDFQQDLLEVIEARDGSHFGGWSQHVHRWQERAALVIRFEDLVQDPIASIERMRPWIDLPQPARDKVPSFDDLRRHDRVYGSGVEHGFDADTRRVFREAKFRRGVVGSWRDELPDPLLMRFLELHGDELVKLGYEVDGPAMCSFPLPGKGDRHERTARFRAPSRVLIDATKLAEPGMDGVKRYVLELLRALVPVAESNREGWDLHVCFGEHSVVSLLDAASALESGGRAALKIAHQLASPLAAWRGDLIHQTLPNTWATYQRLRGRRLTTVHDLSHVVCPHYQTEENIRTLREGLRFSVDRDATFLSVSSSTDRDLGTLYGVPLDRRLVVLEGCDPTRFYPSFSGDPEDVRAKYGIPSGPYLLSLGTMDPRKNLRTMIRAFVALEADVPDLQVNFIIAGGSGWDDANQLRAAAAESTRIRFIGRIDEPNLPWVLGNARGLAYVSHYEGFGLPTVEAMRCGTPVVYGANSAMLEVVADAGLAVDANDVDAIMNAFCRLLQDVELASELRARSLVRSSRLTWARVAHATLEAYRHCLLQPPPRWVSMRRLIRRMRPRLDGWRPSSLLG